MKTLFSVCALRLSVVVLAAPVFAGAGSIDTVIDGKTYTCYSNGPKTCVLNCTLRDTAGKCLSYGADFCEFRAACVPQCRIRQTDGACGAYGADYCGKDAACVPNCTLRKSDGVCGSYTADLCSKHD